MIGDLRNLKKSNVHNFLCTPDVADQSYLAAKFSFFGNIYPNLFCKYIPKTSLDLVKSHPYLLRQEARSVDFSGMHMERALEGHVLK